MHPGHSAGERSPYGADRRLSLLSQLQTPAGYDNSPVVVSLIAHLRDPRDTAGSPIVVPPIRAATLPAGLSGSLIGEGVA